MSATSSTESSPFTTTAPACTVDDAAQIARAHYGLLVTVHALTSERDRNFRLDTADGRQFVLKVANAAEDPLVTNLQTRALLHIAQTDPALPVPRVMATRDGQHEISVRFGDSACVVRLISYLPGEPLHRADRSAGQIVELGRVLARLGLALRGFEHPASGHELLWDLKHAAGMRKLLGPTLDRERLALAERFLDAFEEHALPMMPRLRAQVIHNDFNPHNVLMDPADHGRVTGIIDFGDIVQAPLVNDVATGAAYQVGFGEAPLDGPAAFVGGYHGVSPLEPAEIDIVFDLFAMRQVMTVAITEWRAARYPENRDYILRNNPRAWAGLAGIATLSRAQAQEILRRACGME